MKLVYIANVRIPTEKAHGIQIFKTCEALVKAGAKLELWLPKRRNVVLANRDPFEYYGNKNRFPIVRLATFDLIGWLDFLPGLGYWIQAKTFAWSISRKLRFVESSTIIYSRDIIPLEPVRKAEIQYYYEAHTISKKPNEYQKRIFKGAAGIVTITKALAEEFAKYVPREKVLIAPDGVDLDNFKFSISNFQTNSKFQIRKELGLPEDKKIVMYTGHLYDWKGAAVLLEAARNIKFPISNIQFVFVGGTDYDLQKFRESAKGLGNVLIVGQKPHSEIPKYLAAADVLVLPNSGKFEISRKHTSPLKLFEYMVAGKPIVASNLPSIREILDDSAGYFAEPDNPESLMQKIVECLNNPALAAKRSEKASQEVREFSWNTRAKRILDFINSKTTT